MEAEYDFSDAIKNPYAGRFNGKYIVTIERASGDEHFEVTQSSEN